MIDELRSENPHLLFLDCGGVIPFRGEYRKLKTEIILQAMNLMGYNAMNLAGSDFSFGLPFLEEWSKSVSFPFISSNLVSSDGTPVPEFIKNHAIATSGNRSVGIIGIMPENAFDKIPSSLKPSHLKIIPPKEAIAQLLPGLRDKVDIVILLSQLSIEETTSLVNQVKGISVALSHEKRGKSPVSENASTVVTSCGTKSSTIQIVTVSSLPNGTVSVVQNKDPIILDDNTPHKDEIDQLIISSYAEKLRKARGERDKEAAVELHKELMNGLSISPQEFIRKQMEPEGTQPPLSSQPELQKDSPSKAN